MTSRVSPNSSTDFSPTTHSGHELDAEGTKQTFYRVLYFILRYFLVFMAVFLFCIAMIYAVSNLITMEATNFFCDSKSRDEVLDENLDKGHPQGQAESCWLIDRDFLNEKATNEFTYDLWVAYIDGESFESIFGCLIFSILGLSLLAISLQHGYYVIYDTFYACTCSSQFLKFLDLHHGDKEESVNIQSKSSFSESSLSNNRAFRENKRIKAVRKKWYHKRRQLKQKQQKQKQQQKRNQHKKKKTQQTNTGGCINKVTTYLSKFYVKYNDFYLKYFYFDSKYKALSILVGELFEMLLQTYGLFLLGGINVFNPNEPRLSEDYQIIESFAIIIGLNGILVGIAWIVYVLWHDIWHGTLFFGVIFFLDAIFEIIYILFPLIFVTRKNLDGERLTFFERLGLLREADSFFTFQAILALYFLMSKCWYLMYELDPAHIEDCHHQYLYNMKIGKYFEQVPWIVTKEWVDYQEYKQRHESMHKVSSKIDPDDTKNTIINATDVSPARRATVDQNNRLGNISVVSAPTPFSTRLTSMVRSKVNNLNYDNTNTLTNRNSMDKVNTTSATPREEASDHDPIVTANDKDGLDSEGDIDLVNETAHDVMFRVSSMSHNSVSAPNSHSVDSRNAAHAPKSTNSNNDNKNDSDKSKNGNQMFRKTIVCLSGLLLFGFGLSILVSFVDFIENSYKSKCIPDKVYVNSWDYFNRSDVSEFNKKNPEILVFYHEDDAGYEECRQKAVNLFDYDYPCNCRKFTLTNQQVVSDFEIEILPRIFEKWTMLEAFAVRAWNNDKLRDFVHINFTDNLLNLPHLRSFNVQGYNVGYIDKSIEKLQKLEILRLRYINTPIIIPWENISKLPNLKAIYISEMFGSIVTPFNFEYFCQRNTLIFFMLRYSNLNHAINISDDCIYQLTNLRYFELTFDASTDESYISPLLYTLPKLRTVAIESWKYDLNSLLNFTSYKMTDNAQVYWSESDLCLPARFDDEMSYNMSSTIDMTYLDWYIESGILSNAALIEFVNKFNPCRNPCDAGSIEDSFGCTAYNWGNGICEDDACFNELCNYDNGDCNQDCPCNRTLWFNDKCDTECNVTECDWDFFQCLDVNGTCYYNESNINDTCYKEWTLANDGWCDDNCRNLGNDTCGENEDQACICSGYCATAKLILVDVIGSAEAPIELITLNEACDQWDLIKSVSGTAAQYGNCSLLFSAVDTNKNGYVGLHETIVAFAKANAFDFDANAAPDIKIQQINCSGCVDNSTIYYM